MSVDRLFRRFGRTVHETDADVMRNWQSKTFGTLAYTFVLVLLRTLFTRVCKPTTFSAGCRRVQIPLPVCWCEIVFFLARGNGGVFSGVFFLVIFVLFFLLGKCTSTCLADNFARDRFAWRINAVFEWIIRLIVNCCLSVFRCCLRYPHADDFGESFEGFFGGVFRGKKI